MLNQSLSLQTEDTLILAPMIALFVFGIQLLALRFILHLQVIRTGFDQLHSYPMDLALSPVHPTKPFGCGTQPRVLK